MTFPHPSRPFLTRPLTAPRRQKYNFSLPCAISISFPLVCPLSSLPASAQVSPLLLFFFFFFSPSVCHSVVNVRIQTSSHGYQHGNAQINTRGASPSLIFQQRTIISLRSSVFICVCDLACNLPSGQNAEHSPHSNGQRERITHCSL